MVAVLRAGVRVPVQQAVEWTGTAAPLAWEPGEAVGPQWWSSCRRLLAVAERAGDMTDGARLWVAGRRLLPVRRCHGGRLHRGGARNPGQQRDQRRA